MRGRDGRTTILQRIGYALAILTQLYRMRCHRREDARNFGLAGAHGPLHPPVYVYTMPIYFFIFLAILTFVNLFVDNNNIVLYT